MWKPLIKLGWVCCFNAVVLSACATQPATSPPVLTQQRVSHDQLARNKVATKLNIAADAVTVVSSNAVSFSDSSLNCPQPGMMYAQVITDGYQVIVAAEQQTFDVRVSGNSARICNTPGKTPEPHSINTR